jgi:LysR family transcriptional regulator, transcriptional activator for aaeXAB operon
MYNTQFNIHKMHSLQDAVNRWPVPETVSDTETVSGTCNRLTANCKRSFVKLETVYWDLFVLSRAVAFSNLSTASRHIGISQPQLSRIIKKLEEEIGCQLLDREAKRKSAWTRAAMDLSDEFARGSKELTRKIESASQTTKQTEIRIATLEGMVKLAIQLSHELFATDSFERVEIDVHDIGDLEEHFLRGHYDIIFSFREPGNRKFKYCETVGHQRFQRVESSKDVFVGSHFEARNLQSKKSKTKRKLVISNSVFVRREWLENWGGHGNLPGDTHSSKQDGDQIVLMIGTEDLPKALWEGILKSSKRLK